MFREAVIAYWILVLCILFVGCTFYFKSYHDDKPIYLEKEEKCVGIKCLDTKRKNLAEKTDADDADVKNSGAVR